MQSTKPDAVGRLFWRGNQLFYKTAFWGNEQFIGIYSNGKIVRGMTTSAGESISMQVDWSQVVKEAKATYTTDDWDQFYRDNGVVVPEQVKTVKTNTKTTPRNTPTLDYALSNLGEAAEEFKKGYREAALKMAIDTGEGLLETWDETSDILSDLLLDQMFPATRDQLGMEYDSKLMSGLQQAKASGKQEEFMIKLGLSVGSLGLYNVGANLVDAMESGDYTEYNKSVGAFGLNVLSVGGMQKVGRPVPPQKFTGPPFIPKNPSGKTWQHPESSAEFIDTPQNLPGNRSAPPPWINRLAPSNGLAPVVGKGATEFRMPGQLSLKIGDEAIPVNKSYFNAASKVAPHENFYDVIGHGGLNAIGVADKQPMTAKQLADLIRAAPDYKAGQPIRLLSC